MSMELRVSISGSNVAEAVARMLHDLNGVPGLAITAATLDGEDVLPRRMQDEVDAEIVRTEEQLAKLQAERETATVREPEPEPAVR